MKTTLFALVFAASFTAARALPLVTYGTDFDEFTPNIPLAGQDQWTGHSERVGFLADYSESPSDYWASLGGAFDVAPLDLTTYVRRGFDNDTPEIFTAIFSVDFAITRPTLARPARDTFGWTFQGGPNFSENQVRLVFEPLGDGLDVRLFDIFGMEEPLPEFSLAYDRLYHLFFRMDRTHFPRISITDVATDTETVLRGQNDQVTGSDPNDIMAIAATWTVADAGAFGGNSMVFNDYQVTPEPSALLSALFGGGLLCGRRRR